MGKGQTKILEPRRHDFGRGRFSLRPGFNRVCRAPVTTPNRFNRLAARRKTVETVQASLAHGHTRLKPGVNEISPNFFYTHGVHEPQDAQVLYQEGSHLEVQGEKNRPGRVPAEEEFEDANGAPPFSKRGLVRVGTDPAPP